MIKQQVQGEVGVDQFSPLSSESLSKGRQARMSLPTNDLERLLDPKKPIVTKTDIKGKITYANPAFVDISGFELHELLGQPHNVVRHPSMPRDAFKDLWQTVRDGEPWQGLVKNRCKDGGYYWVNAYVTPLTRDGQKIGYMSVRSKPTDQQKKEAEALYLAVNAGQKSFPFTKTNQGRPFVVDLCLAFFIPVVFAMASLLGNGMVQWLAILASAGFSMAGLLWVRSQVRATNAAMHKALSDLSEGNFRAEIPSSPIRDFNKNHIAFKSMQVNLRAIIADVLSGAEDVSKRSAELSDLSTGLMQSSERQSDGIASVAAALEELSVSVKEISEATDNSSDHAKQAMNVVVEGDKNMQHSSQATLKVAKVVQEAKENIEELNGAVSRINSVTQTITEIAERTNLLALNAAIEAARAGESGRGFAVVADEVRKLAEMTRQSTTEITAMIQEVQEGTAKGQATMMHAVQEVDAAAVLIQEVSKNLEDIKQANTGVAESASDISNMLGQQTQASEEVATSMEHMATLTENNVSSIKVLGDSANVLAKTAAELRTLVQHFESSL